MAKKDFVATVSQVSGQDGFVGNPRFGTIYTLVNVVAILDVKEGIEVGWACHIDDAPKVGDRVAVTVEWGEIFNGKD